jgi:vitamin B12 transporter
LVWGFSFHYSPGQNLNGEHMMRKNYAAALLCPLLTVVSVGEACAGQPTLLDEVVVTASRAEESRKTVSANVTVIDREEIALSAATTVAELLAEKAAGQIRTYPGGLSAVGLRGFNTDTHGNDLQGHVLILLDGRRAGTGNAAKLLTANVERIEIIRGPGAVQYGSAGMGGVINIITRRGDKASFTAEAGVGSFDSSETRLGGTLAKGQLDVAGSLSRSTQGDYETGSGQRYRNTATQQDSLSLNTGWTFAEKQRVGLIFTGAVVDDAGSPGYLSANDLDDRTDKDNWSADLCYTGQAAVGPQWLLRYFFGKDSNSWRDLTGSDPDGWDDGLLSENSTDQQGAQAQVSGSVGPAALTAGFDWLHYKVENSWTPQRSEYSNPALFVLARAALLDKRLSLDAGLRHDWYSTEVLKPAGRDNEDNHFTPQTGVAWLLNEQLKLRARYAQGFVLPSADQLGANFLNYGTRTVGNPDLTPEESSTYEAGADFSHGFLNATLTYFHTDFEDKIIVAPRADGARSWRNLGDAAISGIEGELSHDLGLMMNWTWSVRPTLSLTVLTQREDKSTGEELQNVSSSTLAAGLIAENNGLAFKLNLARLGSQLVQDWEVPAAVPPVVELEASMVADFTAS